MTQLRSEEPSARRTAIALLLRGPHTPREITHLALRAAKHGRDVGLLADLLAEWREEAWPHVLHRITHAAALQRGGICRALGRRRPHAEATVALLLVRALVDVDALVRLEARIALGVVEPEAERLLDPNRGASPRASSGSALPQAAGLVLGLGDQAAAAPLRRFLRSALAVEAQRFGSGSMPALAQDGQHRAGGSSPQLLGLTAQRDPDRNMEQLAVRMAREQQEGMLILRTLVQRPGYVRIALLAYGMLGQEGAPDSSALLRLWRRHLQSRPPVRERHSGAALAGGKPESESSAGRESWEHERTSAAVAWAVTSVLDRSEETFRALWGLLRLTPEGPDHDMILTATQALRPQGPLTRILLDALARGSGRSAAEAADARALLPWCDETARDSTLESLVHLAARPDTPRARRMAVQGIARQLSRPSATRDAGARQLVEGLRRSALRRLPPSSIVARLRAALAKQEHQTDALMNLVVLLIRDGDRDSPLLWRALLALPEAGRIQATTLMETLARGNPDR